MIESLKNGEANVVICKDFSRFFRDYVEIGDYLERIFPFLGVRFIAVNDGYDSDDYKGSTAGIVPHPSSCRTRENCGKNRRIDAFG